MDRHVASVLQASTVTPLDLKTAKDVIAMSAERASAAVLLASVSANRMSLAKNAIVALPIIMVSTHAVVADLAVVRMLQKELNVTITRVSVDAVQVLLVAIANAVCPDFGITVRPDASHVTAMRTLPLEWDVIRKLASALVCLVLLAINVRLALTVGFWFPIRAVLSAIRAHTTCWM